MTRHLDRRTLLRSTAATAVLQAFPGQSHAQGRTGGPPAARVEPVTETLFGTRVTDPYRWMEAEGADWRAYALAQGDWARRTLDAVPGRQALVEAVARRTAEVVLVNGVQTGGDHIFTEVRPAGANTFKLFAREGLHGADRLLIDADSFATEGSHASLDWWTCSPDGRHVVFGISPGGSENSTARIVATRTGALLPETIDRTEYASASWLSDGGGFFYNRLQPGVAADGVDRFKLSACWLHRLGADPAADVEVLAKAISPLVAIGDIDFPTVRITPGSDIALGVIDSGVQNELGLYVTSTSDATAGRPSWKQICTPADKVTGAAVRGDAIYMLTHDGAPHYRVVQTTAAAPLYVAATPVVPESAAVIRNIAAARDGLYMQDLNAGLGGVRRLGPDGTIITFTMPFAGSIEAFYADTLHDGAWFLLQGWVRPSVLCHARPDGRIVQTDIAPLPPVDIRPYTSEEVFATAADGTRIPLSIVYRKGLSRDGSAPLLLHAYGAYGDSIDPTFVARWLPFLDLGGVFAVAHVRGGGELGEDWHLAGQKLTKPNSWRDMIAAAQFLIDNRYTRPGKLAILGVSAGGITVGRFLTERPDLAAVVISLVGVSNTLRGEFSPNGPPNVPEFGAAHDRPGFKALYEMDAYQHVRDGVAYPSVLLTTGLNDPRVSSWEPTKMAARLQAATASNNPVLLRVESDAGHGIGSTRRQRDEETADMIAFILWRTGDPRHQPRPS